MNFESRKMSATEGDTINFTVTNEGNIRFQEDETEEDWKSIDDKKERINDSDNDDVKDSRKSNEIVSFRDEERYKSDDCTDGCEKKDLNIELENNIISQEQETHENHKLIDEYILDEKILDYKDSELSFLNLSNDWILAFNRVDGGRKLCENLQMFLTERAKIEEEYATQLNNIVQKFMSTPMESKGTSDAMAAIRKHIQQSVSHCKEFVDAIRKDILEQTINNTILNHLHVITNIKIDGIDADRSVSRAHVEYRKSLFKYVKTSKEAEEAAMKCERSHTEMPSYKTDLSKEALQKCLAALRAEDDYLLSVSAVNDITRTYHMKIGIILKSLEDMDMKRILCFKDALRKYMVYEMAQIRNMQYDTKQVIEIVEKIDNRADVLEFVNRNKMTINTFKPMQNLSWTQMEQLSSQSHLANSFSTADERGRGGSGISFAASSIAKNILQKTTFNKVFNVMTSPQPPSNFGSNVPADINLHRQIDESVINRLEFQFDSILDKLWNGDIDSFSNINNDFHEEFRMSLRRYVMCRCLHKKLDANLCELPSMKALNALGGICLSLLDWCDSQKDTWSGRSIVYISQKIYAFGGVDEDPQNVLFNPLALISGAKNRVHIKENDETKTTNLVLGNIVKWGLHRTFYHHRYWNCVAFWEEALIITIGEDLRKRLLSQKWKYFGNEVMKQREQEFCANNPCSSMLYSFADSMLSFGITIGNVKHLIFKVCSQFDLTNDYAIQLLECLNTLPKSSENSTHLEAVRESTANCMKKVSMPTGVGELMSENSSFNGIQKPDEMKQESLTKTKICSNTDSFPSFQGSTEATFSDASVFSVLESHLVSQTTMSQRITNFDIFGS